MDGKSKGGLGRKEGTGGLKEMTALSVLDNKLKQRKNLKRQRKHSLAYVLVSFGQIDKNRATSEEGTSADVLARSDQPDYRWRVQLIVGVTTFRLVCWDA